jgi:hypothetical protein
VALDESVRHCSCVAYTHGGLTPAALANVRLCIAKIAIPPVDGRCNSAKSGGRKPPVVRETRLQVIPPTPCDTLDLPKPRRVHVRGAGRKRGPLQLRYSHPRRADARRSSWACVCASKNSFFAGRRSHTNTRAGGVSPPWNTLRMRTRNGQIHRFAVADAVCKATAG